MLKSPLYRFIDRTSLAAMRLGGGLILLSALMVTVDVIFRQWAGKSIAGLDEVSGYFFAIATAAAFSAGLIRRFNVRIEGVYRFVPRPVRVILDFLAIVALVGYLGIVVWVASDLVMSSYTNWSRSISPLQTPLFIPQIVWISFLGLAVVAGLCLIGLSVSALLARDWTALQSLIGPLSCDEEIEIEIESIASDSAAGKTER